MFEKIKAKRNLKKMNKLAKGVKELGEKIHNNDLITEADNLLYHTEKFRMNNLSNKNTVKTFNLECIRKGL